MDTFGQIECYTSVCPSPDNFQINNLQNEVLISFDISKYYCHVAHDRWFSPASSTTKSHHHDITEILLKVALNTKNQIILTDTPLRVLIFQ
jgi:hypothetical protein